MHRTFRWTTKLSQKAKYQQLHTTLYGFFVRYCQKWLIIDL